MSRRLRNLTEQPLSGIVTVLNTPFLENGDPDIEALRGHVEYAVKAGVDGFLYPAMASEVEFLSRKERLELTAAVVDACGGRVPVIGGASAVPEERIGIVKDLMGIGCDGILVAVPYSDPESYRAAVEEVADAGMDYLMIQDWDAAGYGVPVDLITRLAVDIPAFRCLKIEVVPAGVKYTQVLSAAAEELAGAGRSLQGAGKRLQVAGKKLQVAGGWAVMHLIDGLDRGVDIFMPTGMHELYVRILRLYREGQRSEAAALFRRILPILTFSNQHLEISICFFKRLLFRQGVFKTDRVRTSERFWDERNRRLADTYIDEFLELTNFQI